MMVKDTDWLQLSMYLLFYECLAACILVPLVCWEEFKNYIVFPFSCINCWPLWAMHILYYKPCAFCPTRVHLYLLGSSSQTSDNLEGYHLVLILSLIKMFFCFQLSKTIYLLSLVYHVSCPFVLSSHLIGILAPFGFLINKVEGKGMFLLCSLSYLQAVAH